jgi:hypothetical protein
MAVTEDLPLPLWQKKFWKGILLKKMNSRLKIKRQARHPCNEINGNWKMR